VDFGSEQNKDERTQIAEWLVWVCAAISIYSNENAFLGYPSNLCLGGGKTMDEVANLI
jgi:hypothetical protein